MSTQITIKNEQVHNLTGSWQPKKRSGIARAAGGVLGTVGGGIKGAAGGAVKGGAAGALGGAALGAIGGPVGAGIGAGLGGASGAAGGAVLGGVRGAIGGGVTGARKFKKPKVVYNGLLSSIGKSAKRIYQSDKALDRARWGVGGMLAGATGTMASRAIHDRRAKKKKVTANMITINNSEQRKVEQKLLVNRLLTVNHVDMVDNGLFTPGRMHGVGRMLESAVGKGRAAAGKIGRVAKIQGGRAGLRAGRWASKNPKKTALAAGLGAGVAAGAYARHVKNSPGYKAALKKDRGK